MKRETGKVGKTGLSGAKARKKRQIIEKVAATSAGRYWVCQTCGETFEQIWQTKKEMYTEFKNCGKCRRGYTTGKVKAEIPYTPHPGQVLVHNSPARFKLLASGARWGKDRCMVMEFIDKISQMLSEDRGPNMIPAVHAWIVAPTYLLARQIWRELKAYFPRPWIVNILEGEKIIETVNDGLIEVRSADDPTTLVSVGLDIVLITEAARISKLDEVWANLETRLMSPGRGPNGTGGLALINSTPIGRNYYYQMFKWGQKKDPDYDIDWESWQFPSFSNPYLTAKDKNYLKRMQKRYPERIYNQEILGVFLAEGNSVFPTADECATYIGTGQPEPGESYVIGYDPARSIDNSGVVIRNSKGEAVRVEQWRGKPWTRQMDDIAILSQLYNHAHVVMDRTGLGETLPEALAQRGISVDPVYISNLEKEKMVNNLAMLIEQKFVSYPKHEVLINELKDYQYVISKTGTTRYSASAQSRHDDLVTAAMLAFKDFNSPELELPFVGLLGGVSKQTGKNKKQKTVA
ncbi:MAG: hypothetical protein WC958_06170 [Dehalococcoidales bacterium]